MAAGGKKGVKADINITPLVDVVLVLLIIFMVITPMLQRGKDVKLPSAHKSKKDEPKATDPMILSVTSEKKMFLEKDEYATNDLLKEAIKSKLQVNLATPILLKGDVTLTFSDVRKVMDVCRQAGAKGVKLGVEEQKDK